MPSLRCLQQEQREPVRRLRGHEEDVGDVGPRDEPLPARERPALARLLRARLRRLRAPVELGIEEGDRRARVARRDGGEPALLLRLGAGELDRRRRKDRRPVRAGVRRPAHLLEEQGGLDHAEAAAAVRLGQREAEPAELRDLLPQRVALTARVVPQEAHRRGLHVLVEEPAGRVLQELLVGAEREVHGVRPSGGPRALPWAGRARAPR